MRLIRVQIVPQSACHWTTHYLPMSSITRFLHIDQHYFGLQTLSRAKMHSYIQRAYLPAQAWQALQYKCTLFSNLLRQWPSKLNARTQISQLINSGWQWPLIEVWLAQTQYLFILDANEMLVADKLADSVASSNELFNWRGCRSVGIRTTVSLFGYLLMLTNARYKC